MGGAHLLLGRDLFFGELLECAYKLFLLGVGLVLEASEVLLQLLILLLQSLHLGRRGPVRRRAWGWPRRRRHGSRVCSLLFHGGRGGRGGEWIRWEEARGHTVSLELLASLLQEHDEMLAVLVRHGQLLGNVAMWR